MSPLDVDAHREEFLDHIAELVVYWDESVPADRTCREKLTGLVHSVLATIAGVSGEMPGYALVRLDEDSGVGDVEGDFGAGIQQFWYSEARTKRLSDAPAPRLR